MASGKRANTNFFSFPLFLHSSSHREGRVYGGLSIVPHCFLSLGAVVSSTSKVGNNVGMKQLSFPPSFPHFTQDFRSTTCSLIPTFTLILCPEFGVYHFTFAACLYTGSSPFIKAFLNYLRAIHKQLNINTFIPKKNKKTA